MSNITTGQGTSRRDFLKGSAGTAIAGALAAGLVIPAAVHAAGDEKIKVGLIGCGGRGSGAAINAMDADKNVVLTAVGDAFPDRLQSSLNSLKKQKPDQVKVDADHCFTGLDAYQKVIASDVDVVILTTPPGFRPQHLKAAIAAGKHVFTEKPMAVDGPGVRSVLATVEEAKRKNLSIVAGFCWRYSYPERAVFERVHNGAIGDIVSIFSSYNTSELWNHARRAEWSDVEWQVRNWLYFTWLSGDHIVEQAVHTIDKLAWAMQDQPPMRAWGTGGRQVRTDPAFGHIYDHFAIVYEWKSGPRASLHCRQQNGTRSDVSDHIMGTAGEATVLPSRSIKGKQTWKYDGPNNNMYQTEHEELYAGIRAGKPLNDGVRMAYSTLMAIMGRMAAYTGQTITWEQALNSKEELMPANLQWGPMAVPPIAMPGKTKFL